MGEADGYAGATQERVPKQAPEKRSLFQLRGLGDPSNESVNGAGTPADSGDKEVAHNHTVLRGTTSLVPHHV